MKVKIFSCALAIFTFSVINPNNQTHTNQKLVAAQNQYESGPAFINSCIRWIDSWIYNINHNDKLSQHTKESFLVVLNKQKDIIKKHHAYDPSDFKKFQDRIIDPTTGLVNDITNILNEESNAKNAVTNSIQGSKTDVVPVIERGIILSTMPGQSSSSSSDSKLIKTNPVIHIKKGWHKDSFGWWYGDYTHVKYSWAKISGRWYWFDKNGYVNTHKGWEKLGKKWIYSKGIYGYHTHKRVTINSVKYYFDQDAFAHSNRG